MLVTTLTGIIQHTPRVNSTRGTQSERVLNLNVGVRQRVKKDGQWTNETLWVDVALFGGRADGLANILKKGSQVGATGELRVRRYEGRDGTQKTAVELVAHNLWPLDWSPREQAEDKALEQVRQHAGGGGTHRDEFAGQRTKGGYAVRGQGNLLDSPAPGEDSFDGADHDDIPF